MSDRTCPLTWKAAALEDGRLEGSDVVSFELHATRCSDCRAEWKALAVPVAAALAVPVTELSPLAHARRRAALLARANDRFIRPAPARWRPWGLALLGATMVAGAAAIIVARKPAALPVGVQEAPLGAPRCEVVSNERALWRTQVEGTTTRVEVADGTATLVIGRVVAPQRAVIRLPDGEIEAATSQLVVDVAFGRTRAVKVLEGHVVLRPHDEDPVTLTVGETWPRPASATATQLSEAGPALEPAGPTAANGSAVSPPILPPPSPSGGKAGVRRARLASVTFDEAISSFVHASYGQADRELRDFIADFPEDSRCEDAAFLSTVSRWRMGDTAGARARASSYLKAYPHGLRRAEAQQIIDAER